MKWQDVGEMRCSIARSLSVIGYRLSVIGDRWTVLILRNAFMRMRRFDDFRSSLGLPKHSVVTPAKRHLPSRITSITPSVYSIR